MKIFHTLKFLVPALVACFGVAVIAAGYLRHLHLETELMVRNVKGEAFREGTRLSGISQHLFRKGLQQTADIELSYASMSPTLELGFICDGKDTVKHATQLQWRDLQLAETPLAFLAPLLDEARVGMSGLVSLAVSQEHVSAVFPFLEKDGVARGAVLLHYDLRAPLLDARRAAFHESIAQGLGLLAGCLGLWLLLDGLITRRMQRMLHYAEQVGDGLNADIHVTGQDEIGVVARRFSQTVDRLRSTELQLLEAGEQERKRVGHDLHDDVCQRIAAAQLKIGVLGSSLRKDGSPLQARAVEVAADLAAAADITRGYARGLAPGILDMEGLDKALEDLAEHVENLFHITVTCHSELAPFQLENPLQVHLFRIAQELATNAAKHAAPSRIEIRCSIDDRVLKLEVENDGSSFTGDSSGSRGLGLALVRQRVRAIGARLHFQTLNASSGGTLVTCEVPI